MTYLSIISPVFLAEDCIDELVRRVTQEAQQITENYEFILVNDGSPDKSWQKIEAQCQKNERVKAIRLSRNFGQHAAITAGLAEAAGELVIVMDCDLQDDPQYFKPMIEKALRGSEIVLTKKKRRKHDWIKNFFARLFRIVFKRLADAPSFSSDGSIGNYSLLTRKVVDSFLQVTEAHRHYLMILSWLGFESSFIEVKHYPRHAGKSSYNLYRLIKHAMDGITSQSDKLLYFTANLGILVFGLSCVGSITLVTFYFLYGFKEGWTSLFLAILGSTGLILMSLGVVGIYIGKVFEQVKYRPLFLVSQRINSKSNANLLRFSAVS